MEASSVRNMAKDANPEKAVGKPPARPQKHKIQKAPKVKGMPNKHLHARTTFLYQAATYLTLQAATAAQKKETANPETAESMSSTHKLSAESALALHLGTHLREVSRKGQVRLSTDLKRTVCKTCNAILIPGQTSQQMIENESKRGKASADVLVVHCHFCANKKRFPIGATRQQKTPEQRKAKRDARRKAKREAEKKVVSANKSAVDAVQPTTPALETALNPNPT